MGLPIVKVGVQGNTIYVRLDRITSMHHENWDLGQTILPIWEVYCSGSKKFQLDDKQGAKLLQMWMDYNPS